MKTDGINDYFYKYIKYNYKYHNITNHNITDHQYNDNLANMIGGKSPKAFVDALDKIDNTIYGENNSPEYNIEGVGDLRVAFFFKLVRGVDIDEIKLFVKDIIKLATRVTDPRILIDLIVTAFHTRDIRNGKGERKIFYYMIIELYKYFPKTIIATLPLISHYGYYKDYFLMIESIYENIESNNYNFDVLVDKIYDFIVEELIKDIDKYTKWNEKQNEKQNANQNANTHPQLTLLAKYIPKENKHFDRKYGMVDILCKKLSDKQNNKNNKSNKTNCRKQYRKIVSVLNNLLDVPEIKMAANNFAQINFANISGKALFKYRKAFLNENLHNKKRQIEDRMIAQKNFLEYLKTPNTKTRQFEIYNIVRVVMDSSYTNNEKILFQKLWDQVKNDLINTVKDTNNVATQLSDIKFGKILPIIDVSGSMSGTPMHVAISLGIMLSEINDEKYRDRFITFSKNPSWVNLSGIDNIVDKIIKVAKSDWGTNTNFEAVYDMIIDVIVKKKLDQHDVPDLIVFSDMQFDEALNSTDPWETHHENIVRKFRQAGIAFDPPKIIYWNLRSNTIGFPIQANTPNTIMISGFSPKLFKHILMANNLSDFEIPTPYDMFRTIINDSRYDIIRDMIKVVGEIEIPSGKN